MRSPESLKSICSMFKNAEHKTQPEKYKNNLLNHVNYANPDFEKTLKTDVQTRTYGGGELKLRVFKLYFNRSKLKNKDGRNGGVGERRLSGVKNKNVQQMEDDSSESSSCAGESNANGGGGKDAKAQKGEEETLLQQYGMSTLQTLNDQ